MEEMTTEEISLILESDLTLEEKSSILASYDWSKDKKLTASSPIKLQKKIEDTKANTKKEKDDDRKSERKIMMESNANAEEKGLVDPLTDEEISSILESKLTSEEKSSLLMESYLIKDEIKTYITPSRVELKHVETKPKEDNHNELRISKGMDRSLSQGNNQLMETGAKPEHDPIPRHGNGSPKRIYKGSSLRSQQAPGEDCHLLLELKEHMLVIAKEIKEPQTNPEGGDAETIYKEEAICQKCYEPMFDENNVLKDENVLKAKCKCKLALIHANCVKEGSRCRACEEQIRYIPVTLAIATSSTSSPQKAKKENLKRLTSVSKRSSWCCFYINDT